MFEVTGHCLYYEQFAMRHQADDLELELMVSEKMILESAWLADNLF